MRVAEKVACLCVAVLALANVLAAQSWDGGSVAISGNTGDCQGEDGVAQCYRAYVTAIGIPTTLSCEGLDNGILCYDPTQMSPDTATYTYPVSATDYFNFRFVFGGDTYVCWAFDKEHPLHCNFYDLNGQQWQAEDSTPN